MANVRVEDKRFFGRLHLTNKQTGHKPLLDFENISVSYHFSESILLDLKSISTMRPRVDLKIMQIKQKLSENFHLF